MSNVMLAMLIGAAAALPLVLGAWITLKRSLPNVFVGLTSAFGAGALISASEPVNKNETLADRI